MQHTYKLEVHKQKLKKYKNLKERKIDKTVSAGNSLKKVLTPTEDPAYTEIRTFTENGKRMTVTLR